MTQSKWIFPVLTAALKLCGQSMNMLFKKNRIRYKNNSYRQNCTFTSVIASHGK